jgi:hypothetical protein
MNLDGDLLLSSCSNMENDKVNRFWMILKVIRLEIQIWRRTKGYSHLGA